MTDIDPSGKRDGLSEEERARLRESGAADVGEPVDELELRVRAVELRLWRGLVLGRMLLPLAILASLFFSHPSLSRHFGTTGVWAALAIWSAVTTPIIWGRLSWVRTLPAAFFAESAALIALVVFGFGTREWHLVHSSIPLIFCAIFVSRRATVLITAALVAAVWAPTVLSAAGFKHGVEPPLGPATPSAVYVLVAGTLLFVRALFDDLLDVAAAQRAAGGALRAFRADQFRRRETAELSRKIVASVAGALSGLTDKASELEVSLAGQSSERAQNLVALCDSVETTLGELSLRTSAPTPSSGASTVGIEMREIVRRFRPHGAIVLTIAPSADHSLAPADIAPFRRFVSEALANATKYGSPPVNVRVGSHQGTWLAVENRSEHGFAPRPGGAGLRNLRDDAALLGGTLRLSHDAGVSVVRLDLSAEHGEQPTVASVLPSPRSFKTALQHRRHTYETAMFSGRLALAIVSLAIVRIVPASDYDGSRSLFTLTGAALIVWYTLLLARRRAVSGAARRRPSLVWVDGAAVISINLLEGGMLSPWYGLSLTSLMPAATYATPIGAAGYAILLALSLLGGYQFATPLGLHFENSGITMPQDFVLACLTIAVGSAIFVGVRWAFDALSLAIRRYRKTMRDVVNAERSSARSRAQSEAGRELHNKLLNHVHAASIAVEGILKQAPDNRLARAIEARLELATSTLETIHDSLAVA